MSKYAATMNHLIARCLWLARVFFVCPIIVGANGVMYMCGEGEEDCGGGCDSDKDCGCDN